MDIYIPIHIKESKSIVHVMWGTLLGIYVQLSVQTVASISIDEQLLTLPTLKTYTSSSLFIRKAF